MNEYVDNLYLKLSKEEFIEEYVKARNKQHTLKDYDLYVENSAIIRAFEAQIAFMTIYERGYRYDGADEDWAYFNDIVVSGATIVLDTNGSTGTSNITGYTTTL